MIRFNLVIILTFLVAESWSQVELKDTVKIPVVKIEAERSSTKSTNQQTIDSATLQLPFYQNLDQSLQQNANLFIKSYGIGSQATLAVRGANASQTQVLWNGFSLNSPLHGSIDLALFPSFFIDETEVDYGLSSLTYSAGGLGGAVRANNQLNFKPAFHLQLGQELGSFGHNSSRLKLYYSSGKWSSESRLFYRQSDNDFTYTNLAKRDLNEEQLAKASLLQQGFMQTLGYKLNQKSHLEARVWWYESDRNLPPLMNLGDYKENQQDQFIRSFVTYKRESGKYQLELKTAWFEDHLKYQNDRANIVSTNRVKANKSVADFSYNWNENWQYRARINTDLTFFESDAYEETKREEISSFQEVSFRRKIWQLKAKLRNLWVVDEGHFLLPAFSIKVQPIKGLDRFIINSNIGYNVKYPSLNDLYLRPGGNPSLEAEKSNNLDLGLVYTLEATKEFQFTLSTTAFYSDIENYIQWRPSGLGYWQALNLLGVESYGLENRLSGNFKTGEFKGKVNLNYTYTRAYKTATMLEADASVDKQLIYLPEHQFNSSMGIAFKNFELNLQHSLMGARYITSDNSEFIPYYQLLDLSLAKVFKLDQNQLKLSFSIMNLFDTDYQSIQWRPMPGRNYLVRLQYQFNR